MTDLATFEARLTPIFGGDYFANSSKFFKVQTALKSNLAADEAGPRRYDENLALETVSYTQELADRRREEPVYPDEVQTDISEHKKTLLTRSGILAGAVILLAVLFMVFGGGDISTRLIVGNFGGFAILAFIGGRAIWSWKLYKRYIDKDVLYKLPDTDFVSKDEQSEFKRKRRLEDAQLIERLTEMRASAQSVAGDIGKGVAPLYNLNRSTQMAVIALQDARDDERDEVYGEYVLPERAEMPSPERYRNIREAHPYLSKRSAEDLMRLELMIKTVAAHMGESASSVS